MAEQFEARVIGFLDTTKIEEALKNIKNVKLIFDNVDTSNLINKIQAELDKHRFNIQVGNVALGSGAQSGVRQLDQDIRSSLKSIDLVNGGLGNMRNILQGAGFNKSAISAITQDFSRMEIEVAKVTTTMRKNGNIVMKIDGIQELGDGVQRAVSIMREYDKETGKVANESKTFSQSFMAAGTSASSFASQLKKVDNAIATDKIRTSLSGVNEGFENLKNKASVAGMSTHSSIALIENDLTELNNLQQILMNPATSDADRVAAYAQWESALSRVKNVMGEFRTEVDKTLLSQQTLSKAGVLSNDIQTWMNNNKQAAQQYGTELVSLQNRLKNVRTPAELKDIQRRFNEIKTEAKAAGTASSGFGQQLKQAVLQAAGLASIYQIMQKVVQITKEGVKTVIELDDALVDLKKTTTMSAKELTDFYYDANESAKMYGVTTQEIIQSAAEWSRLGYSDKEAATKMAELSSQFKMISPGMSMDTATTGLVSIMKAYDIDVNNVLDGVMSKVNKVGNTFATTNEDIVRGLERSSAALSMTGTSLEQNIALFTAGQEIVQNADMVGTALRTMSMRIRGYDEETEELSADLQTITGDLVDLTKAASNNYQGISIFKDGSQTEFKELGDYMSEIASIYDELSAKQQQDLLEKMFGKRTATTGAAILKNIDSYREAMDTMAHSAGSADAEMSIVMESISYHANELKQSLVGLAQDAFQSDTLKGFIDGLTSGVNAIDFLAEHVGKLPMVVGAAVAAFSATKWKSMFTPIQKQGQSFIQNLNSTFQNGFKPNLNFESISNDISNLNRLLTSTGNIKTSDAFKNLSASAQDLAASGRLSAQAIAEFEIEQKQAHITTVAQNQSLITANSLIGEYNSSLASANNGLTNCGISQEQFVSSVNQGNSYLGGYLKSLHGANASLGDYIKYLAKTKASTIALNATTKVLNFTVNAFKTALSSIAITVAITAIMKGFEALKNAMRPVEEKIADINAEIDDLTSKAKDAVDEFRNLKTSSDEIVPRFTELVQKAGFNGSQGSLSNEEYKEFIDLSNQLAKLFPELATGVDENGNSIIRFTGEVDSFTKSVENLVEQARILTAEKVRENANEVFDSAKDKKKLNKKKQDDYTFDLQLLTSIKSQIDDVDADVFSHQIINVYEKIYGSMSWSKYVKEHGDETGAIDWYEFINGDDFEKLVNEITRREESLRKETDNSFNAVKSIIIASLGSIPGYLDLDSDMQKIVSSIVDGLNFNQFSDKTADEVYQFIQDNIINPFANAELDLSSLQDQLKKGEITGEEFITRIKEGLSSVELSSDVINGLNEMGIEGSTTEEVIDNLAKQWAKTAENEKKAAENAEAFANKKSSIKDFKSNLEKLQKIYQDIANGGSFDFSSILDDDFQNTFGKLGDAYNDFMKVIAEAPNDVNACKSAFDNLATAYVNNIGNLEDLDENTKAVTIAMLEQIGVANATEVVEEALVKQKVLAAAGDFRDMTVEETASVYALCKALAVEQSVLDKINRLKNVTQMISDGVIATDADGTVWDESRLNAEKTKLENELRDYFENNTIELNFDFSKLTEGLKASTSSLPEQYESDLKEIKRQLDMGEKTEAEYYEALEKLSNDYLTKDEKFVDELNSNRAAIRSFQQKSIEELYNATKKLVEQELQDQIDALDAETDAIKDSVAAQKEALEAASEAYNTSIEKKISAIESEIDRQKAVADAAKKRVEAEKKAMQDSTKAQISAYNAQKDSIKKTADAEKKAAEDRYKAIEKEIKGKISLLEKEKKEYEKLADAKKKALQDEVDSEDYEYELSKKQASLTELNRELASLQNNNSASAQKRKAELQNEIAEMQREIYTFQRDRNIDLAVDSIESDLEAKQDDYDKRVEALNDELDKKKEIYEAEVEQIEAVRDAQIESIEAQIDALNNYMDLQEAAYDRRIEQIEAELAKREEELNAKKTKLEEEKKAHEAMIKAKEKKLEEWEKAQTQSLENQKKELEKNLNNQEYLHNATLKKIAEDNGSLYDELNEYNKKYGDGINNSIISMWNAATRAVNRYKIAATATGIADEVAKAVQGYASGTMNLPYSGIVQTDERGYEIKLNRKSGNNYEFMNSGSVILPNDFTSKIMAFVANPESYIRHILPNGTSNVGTMVQENVSNIVNNSNTPVEFNYSPQYTITGDSPEDIAKQIDKIAQRNIDKAFDKLNAALRKNGMGRRINQMA